MLENLQVQQDGACVLTYQIRVLLYFCMIFHFGNTGRKSSQTNLRKCTGTAGRGRRADVSAPLLGQLLFAQQRERVELAPTYCSTFVAASLSCVVYCEFCTFQYCSSLRVRIVR